MKWSNLLFGIVLLVLIPGSLSAQTPEEVLEMFDAEPSIMEVQAAAAAYAHIDDDELANWSLRAHMAPLLPRLRVQYYDRNYDMDQWDDDQQFTPVGEGLLLSRRIQDYRRQERSENRLMFQGDWDFQDLIFNSNTLRVAKERSDRVEQRERLLTTITSLFYERRRAQIRMVLEPPTNAMERLRRELEIQELTAGLDARTGGWFSRQLSAAGLPTY